MKTPSERIAWKIEMLESKKQETLDELKNTLRAAARNFEYTAQKIEEKSPFLSFSRDYVQQETAWITEYATRVEEYNKQIDLLKQVQSMFEVDAK